MEEKIVAAIAAYLHENTATCNGFGRGEWVEFLGTLNTAHFTHSGFCKEIAAEIATSIKPLLEAEAQAFAGWICHQVVAGRTYNKLWLDYQESKKVNP